VPSASPKFYGSCTCSPLEWAWLFGSQTALASGNIISIPLSNNNVPVSLTPRTMRGVTFFSRHFHIPHCPRIVTRTSHRLPPPSFHFRRTQYHPYHLAQNTPLDTCDSGRCGLLWIHRLCLGGARLVKGAWDALDDDELSHVHEESTP
jgi:hypothetical protein